MPIFGGLGAKSKLQLKKRGRILGQVVEAGEKYRISVNFVHECDHNSYVSAAKDLITIIGRCYADRIYMSVLHGDSIIRTYMSVLRDDVVIILHISISV